MRTRPLYPLMLQLTLGTCLGAAQTDRTISADGVNGIRLCQALSGVRDKFPLSRDTIVSSEGAEWPAKIVPLDGGSRILFEASWSDTTHIWGITTNSPRYPTPRGYRVGMTLGDLLAKGEKLDFSYEEGYIVVTVASEQVAFLPDDSTATAFLSRSPRAFDSLQALPRSARIKELIVGGDCRH